ncbi:arginine deiminase family protein [Candidatus Saccharibacteria bacterium]|nr:arginine deiminase family protein [Candidatus Saccharibacteria bacterium]
MVVDDTFMVGGIDSSGDFTSRSPDLLTACMDIMDQIRDDKFSSAAFAAREDGFPIILEGGDVIVHDGTIYVGQGGQWTNRLGLELMKALWGDKFKIQPIHMKPEAKVTHLDCVFNPISADTAIVHFDPMTVASQGIIQKHFDRLIRLKRAEYAALAANVFSIGGGQIFIERQQERLRRELKRSSFDPIPTKFDKPIRAGGSFRCATVPLRRESESQL